MSRKSYSGAPLGAALVLLAVSGVCIGYGLCQFVHDMDGAAVLLGVGGSMAGLATIFVVQSQKKS